MSCRITVVRVAGQWTVSIERAPGDIHTIVSDSKAAAKATALQLTRVEALLVPRPVARPDPGSLRGPIRDKDRGWLVRWTEEGTHRSFASASKAEALAERRRRAGTLPVSVPELKSFKTPRQVIAAVEKTAMAASQAVARGDREALMQLRKYSAVLADCGRVIVQFDNHAEAVEELRRVTEALEGLHAGKEPDDAERASPLARPAETLKSGAGPGKKPHRSRDPIPN